MTAYLLHLDFEGTPIGIWNESGDSYYPNEHSLQKSARNLMATRKETWPEFAEHMSGRISHRDWWEVYTTEESDLEKVWTEAVPFGAPLDLE